MNNSKLREAVTAAITASGLGLKQAYTIVDGIDEDVLLDILHEGSTVLSFCTGEEHSLKSFLGRQRVISARFIYVNEWTYEPGTWGGRPEDAVPPSHNATEIGKAANEIEAAKIAVMRLCEMAIDNRLIDVSLAWEAKFDAYS